ncbi:MAG: L-ribulose-5-phosphate 3-epimerase [Alkalispirochaetaceae bacterium]
MRDCPLGLYEKALPPAEWPGILSRAKKLGFDFVEMSIDEAEQRLARLDWTQQERKGFTDAVRDTGMRVPSICLSGNRRYPIGSGDPKTARKGAEMIRKAVDLSVDIGVRIIQLAGYDVYYDESSTEETRERFAQNLREAVEYAASRGVMLSMEIMDTRLMSSISRFLYYRGRIPSPWFTVYPDLGNLSAWNDNAAEELDLGLRMGVVAAVHLKDTYAVTADSPGQFRDVPFGEGCVDFPRLLAVLKKHRYTGQFLMEMWNRKGEEDVQRVVEAREWVVQRLEEADSRELLKG